VRAIQVFANKDWEVVIDGEGVSFDDRGERYFELTWAEWDAIVKAVNTKQRGDASPEAKSEPERTDANISNAPEST
jgi:hypothetical protein